MSITPVLDRTRRLEGALAEALRQQGADVEDHHGHLVAFVSFDGPQILDRPKIDISRLACDVERAMS